MQWNVFYKNTKQLKDELAVLGVDSDFKLILGDYYTAGHMTDEEVWRLILNHNRLTSDDGDIRSYNIQMARRNVFLIHLNCGCLCKEIEIWTHFTR